MWLIPICWSIDPQRVGPWHKHLKISHKNWGKELISTQISWKYAWFSFPCYRRTSLWNGRPWEWDDFHFLERQANLKQTRSVILLRGCKLVALKKHELCQPVRWQTRSGWSHYKAWLAEDSLTGCRAAWCREELQSKRLQSCKRIIKWKKLKKMFKCPLVDETLSRCGQSETRPRPKPSHILPRPRRDRDVWKNTSRDRLETETSRPRLQLKTLGNCLFCACALNMARKQWNFVKSPEFRYWL